GDGHWTWNLLALTRPRCLPGRPQAVNAGVSVASRNGRAPAFRASRFAADELCGSRCGGCGRLFEDCPDECGGQVDANGVADLLGDLALGADELVVRLVV